MARRLAVDDDDGRDEQDDRDEQDGRDEERDAQDVETRLSTLEDRVDRLEGRLGGGGKSGKVEEPPDELLAILLPKERGRKERGR